MVVIGSNVLINGDKLKKARLHKKISVEELAALATLSTQQIQQIEEGGITAFFSYAWKVRVAKRVGYLLDLLESEFLSE